MKILGADERLAQKSGAKILIIGPSGVGKTSLLRTLDQAMLSSTLFVDIEAGDIAVADLPVASVRPRRWEDCRDVACILGGANPALPPTACYSEAHYKHVAENAELARLASFQVLFVDSLTAASRLSLTWAEQQPEAISDRAAKGPARDLRAARSADGAWLQQLQHARGKNVVFVAVLERVVDDSTHRNLAPAARGQQDRPRAPRHRRSNHHHALGRLRRRQASARLRVHVAEPVGISRKRSQRTARADSSRPTSAS